MVNPRMIHVFHKLLGSSVNICLPKLTSVSLRWQMVELVQEHSCGFWVLFSQACQYSKCVFSPHRQPPCCTCHFEGVLHLWFHRNPKSASPQNINLCNIFLLVHLFIFLWVGHCLKWGLFLLRWVSDHGNSLTLCYLPLPRDEHFISSSP